MAPSKLIYSREILDASFQAELMPLLEAHRVEISLFPDVPLGIDWQAYYSLQGMGGLHVFTVRADGILVGYAVYFVRLHIHYEVLCAFQDILFLHPDYRHGSAGSRLIKFSEKELAAYGVDVITQHTKQHKNLSAMLERMGYKVMDITYFKRLGHGV